MSIPGVFSPVAHGNKMYSDGGAVDNLFVDVARSMGAQIVISSYLNGGPPNPASLGLVDWSCRTQHLDHGRGQRGE